jgi:hypothetical protein
MTAKHLTVRNVPREIGRALDAERRRRGTSLNQTVLDLLASALGVRTGRPAPNGLVRLAGTWSERDLAELEAATADFERTDDELWR